MRAAYDDSGEDTPQLRSLVALVSDTLGPDLVGAYLHGSAVLGGMTPTSDIDLLAVSRRPLADAERERLVVELLDLSVPPASDRHRRPESRPIDLTIVVESAVRPWRYPPEMEFQYGDWLRNEIEAGDMPARVPNPGLAIVLELARRGGRRLLGPAPDSLFEPVPWHDLVASMAHGLEGLLADLESEHTQRPAHARSDPDDPGNRRIQTQGRGCRLGRRAPAARLAAVLHRARELYLAGQYGPWDAAEQALSQAAHHLAAEIRAVRISPTSHVP